MCMYPLSVLRVNRNGYTAAVSFLRPARYEPEIAKFVKEHGPALGIPNSPCTPEQQKWEAISEQRRKQ